ncbi:MAG: GntR family transcriptional regulator, partial [Streptosporangiaceae bacterium]
MSNQLAPGRLAPAEQPRYVLIARAVRDAIEQGVLPVGDRLPAERELCRRFSVSRATIRRALVELETQGCVKAASTRGWFVTALVEPNVLMGFTDLAAHRGFATASRVLASTVRAPNLDEAEALRAPPGSVVLELERVRLMDGVPVGWQRAIAAAWLAPSLADLRYEHASLFQGFREHDIVPTRADYGVAAIPADARASELLTVTVGTCLLQVKAVTSDQHGRPIEISEGMFLGDRYRFTASVSSETRQ